MSWILFKEAGFSPSGKTRTWDVLPTDGGLIIGRIYWYSKWRKYVFAPLDNAVFEEDCLRDIASFCESATKQHKRWKA
jgi:hypothetical protein